MTQQNFLKFQFLHFYRGGKFWEIFPGNYSEQNLHSEGRRDSPPCVERGASYFLRGFRFQFILGNLKQESLEKTFKTRNGNGRDKMTGAESSQLNFADIKRR